MRKYGDDLEAVASVWTGRARRTRLADLDVSEEAIAGLAAPA